MTQNIEIQILKAKPGFVANVKVDGVAFAVSSIYRTRREGFLRLSGRVLTEMETVLGGRAADAPNLILAGVVIAMIAPVTVFLLAQRYFVENVASSGLKG